ncbi:MAG: MotA/TolQ/ExbB proton channel family protein [Deltaproteobacteria bacterium]|nr:MotA/TolQ/ExbB proton channel family protein [Deltaproteobacteria bacterium]
MLLLFLISNMLGGIEILTSIKSALMVLGGTLLCSLLAYPLQIFRDLRKSLQELWETKGPDYADILDQIENLARLRRVSGPRELNTAGDKTDNIFLQKGIELIVDGYDRHEILCIMEKEYEFYFSAKEAQINLLNTLARFAPAFGFVGTIIGLINILNHMEEPDLLGPGMALALLTTLYGLLFANLCFLPLAKKLSEKVRNEALFLNIILEGLIDIAESKNPISIAHRLRSYLSLHMSSPSTRPSLLEKVVYSSVPLEKDLVPDSRLPLHKNGDRQHV